MKYVNISRFIIGLSFCQLFLSACAKDEVDTMGDIHGIVSDESGNPIQAASVTLTPTGKTTTTGDDGRFEFNDLEPRQYTVSVTKVAYASNSKTLTIRAGETSKGDIILAEGMPQLKVNVSELIFDKTDNIRSFEITNAGFGILEWQVKEEADWISVEPTHGTTSKGASTVSVKVERAGLATDIEHTYTLNVISTSGGTKELKIRVPARIPKKLAITPKQLDFSTNKTEEYLTIKKETGEGSVSYTLSANQSWILLGQTSDEVSENENKIKVSVDRTGLAPGTKHTANITLEGNDANNIVIPVVMEVETVALVVSSTSLDFSTDDSNLSFTLNNPKDIAIHYTITKDASWLSLSKLSGTLNASEDPITATVTREGLSVGTHTATITITAPGSRAITIPVSVTIKAEEPEKPEESYESVKITSCDSRIDIKIIDCKRSGTSVVLNYTIENTGMGKDIPDFRIYPVGGMTGNSFISDDEGNQYKLPKITLGTASSCEQIIQNILPLYAKVKASITIKNVSATATQLSLVKMECLAYPNSEYHLADKYFTFREVPIY